MYFFTIGLKTALVVFASQKPRYGFCGCTTHIQVRTVLTH